MLLAIFPVEAFNNTEFLGLLTELKVKKKPPCIPVQIYVSR